MRLEGYRAESSYFHFAEAGDGDLRTAVAVLQGKLAGCIYRRCFSRAVAADLASRFRRSPFLRTRVDGVTASYLGTFAFQKLLGEYFNEVDKFRPVVESFFNLPHNPFSSFMHRLSDALQTSGFRLRSAEHQGRKAASGVIRSIYAESGEFLLRPHEDEAMLASPTQIGFEIQKVADHAVCGLNMCIENDSGGALNYWNIRPDAASRERFGTQNIGDFYPAEALEEFDLIRVQINPGDIYIFNGGFIHAVERCNQHRHRRTTMSCFLGFRDDNTVIAWS